VKKNDAERDGREENGSLLIYIYVGFEDLREIL
jgi:hypothetical protein